MASPYSDGTKVASVFSSRNVDILSEKISVAPARDFKAASYIVEYNIKTDTGGKQIPLLFYAMGYDRDFKVWVDDDTVSLAAIPNTYAHVENTPFFGFGNIFQKTPYSNSSQLVGIYWRQGWEQAYSLSDLKYFETNLIKGVHKIRVEYTARYWTAAWDWVKQYSFNYSLSPARFWKSFGTLQINIDTANFKGFLTTNLGRRADTVSGSVKTWNFTKLPADTFEIYYKPQVGWLASLLLTIQPWGLTLIFSFILVVWHIRLLKSYRKANPLKKHSPVLTIGIVLVPILAFIFFFNSFDMIDAAIGNDASHRHGYIFLAVFLYPFVLLPYWLIMWLIDRYTRKKLLPA